MSVSNGGLWNCYGYPTVTLTNANSTSSYYNGEDMCKTKISLYDCQSKTTNEAGKYGPWGYFAIPHSFSAWKTDSVDIYEEYYREYYDTPTEMELVLWCKSNKYTFDGYSYGTKSFLWYIIDTYTYGK
jgi:hypothetical protein